MSKSPLSLLIPLVAVCGCARLQPSLVERELVGGATVVSLVAKSDTAVVLLYQPSDSFVCYGALQPWLEWRRRHPGRVALVFTRPPTRSERTQLATYRIRADGILRPSILDRIKRATTPAELLLVDGRVVESTRIKSTLVTPLYRRLAGKPPVQGR
jgi:hypothetical protein